MPEAIFYEGQVTVDGTPFDGTGAFKFAIVDDGTENAETGTAEAEVHPSGFVIDVHVLDSSLMSSPPI